MLVQILQQSKQTLGIIRKDDLPIVSERAFRKHFVPVISQLKFCGIHHRFPKPLSASGSDVNVNNGDVSFQFDLQKSLESKSENGPTCLDQGGIRDLLTCK